MTPTEIAARVAKIDAESADAEGAHSDEDELYRDVLNAIAFGARRPAALARAALKAADIDFPRWCA